MNTDEFDIKHYIKRRDEIIKSIEDPKRRYSYRTQGLRDIMCAITWLPVDIRSSNQVANFAYKFLIAKTQDRAIELIKEFL